MKIKTPPWDDPISFRPMANSLGESVLVCDRLGNILYWNNACELLFGMSAVDESGKLVTSLFSEQWLGSDWQNRLGFVVEEVSLPNESWHLEGVCRHYAGDDFPVEIICTVWEHHGEPYITMVLRDISRRKVLEARELRSLMSRIAISALLEIGLEPLPLKRKLEICLEVILAVPWLAVQSKGSIFMATADEHLEMVVQKGLHPHLLEACRRIPFGYCLCGRAAQQKEIVFSDSLDDRHDVTYSGIRQHGHYCAPILLQNRLVGVLNLYVDAGHRCDLEEEAFLATIANTLAGLMAHGLAGEMIQHMANHDVLTGLPNRLLFHEHLEQELRQASRREKVLAILFIDLDHFKEVNDTLGHEAGDILLKTVAERFRSCLRKSDVLARIGGDEFTVLLPDIGGVAQVMIVGEKLLQSLEEPIVIKGQPCRVGASIGISLHPDHGQTAEDLLRHADQAMYAVKNGGRHGIQLFKKENAVVTEEHVTGQG